MPSPIAERAETTSAYVFPTRLGTDTGNPADSTTRTTVPRATGVPGLRACEITTPKGMVVEYCPVATVSSAFAAGHSPEAFARAITAALCDRPTTLGTVTIAAPVDTTTLTGEPTP